jgi:Fur family transcriptional regulator, iron response regulator
VDYSATQRDIRTFSDFLSAALDCTSSAQKTPDGGAQRDFSALLCRTGLRPTRQRLALCALLFSNGHRHVTAEMLRTEAIAARLPLSLATVYNNLRRFTQAGLVQQIAVDGSKAFFDTNTTAHQHFFLVAEHALVDIPASDVALGKVPEPPDGYEIARIDVVVRLRRKQHGPR